MKLKILAIAMILTVIGSTFIASASTIEKPDKENISNAEPLWQQINEDGFGDKQNFATRGIEVYDDYLVVGIWNFKNLVFNKPWRPRSFLREFLYETFVNKTDTTRKYVVSNGCEIWCYNEEDWRPLVAGSEEAIMPAGFGNRNNLEGSVLKEFKGFLYAFIYNEIDGGQVWRTEDLFEEWELVVEGGFGNIYNKGVMVAEIFNDELYVGTMNFEHGNEIFRTSNGVNWTAVVGGDSNTESGFGTKDNYYCHSMVAYNSYLYVGTTTNKGCEIWRTQNGVNWVPVVAFGRIKAKLQGLAFSKGFGKGSLIDGIRTMIVYNDELYLGSTRLAHYRLSFMNRYFSTLFSISSPSMGAQIWKYNESNNKWKQLVGGIGQRNTCNGFGDSKNMQMWSIETYDNCVYMGTMHAESFNIILKRNGFLNWNLIFEMLKGSAELWRYDGTTWEQAIGDEAHLINPDIPPNGFGDQYNWGFRTMKAYNNSLYVGTINFATGCEVWKLGLE